VQALAAWLVARPQNAVIALAATLLLPLLQMVSGVIMVLLVLKQGARLAVIEGVVAGVILASVALVTGAPLVQILVATLSTWVPAIMLGLVLQATRSLTLTVLGFHVVIDDMVSYWDPVMTVLLDWTRENSLHEQARLMESDPLMTANMLTMAIVLSSWMLYVVYLVFGYWLYKLMPGETGDYGRFSDLNFGRVIALVMAFHFWS